ncbi:YrhB domain-containing protein [Micromonospora sp. NPDC005087]|uniref:YrhB domain-containing protein n=1 Tax=Micromonospora sp. NPDC005087 TaxID=3364225 RepID=UPI0036A83650
MTDEEASEIAFAFLADRVDEIRTGEWVIAGTREHETAWSVSYQARAFIESGRIADALAGNGPVVVPKSGVDPWLAWSGRPVEEQIAEHRLTLR